MTDDIETIGVDWASQPSMTIIEIWDRNTGQNVSRVLKTEDGREFPLPPLEARMYFVHDSVRGEPMTDAKHGAKRESEK